MDFLFVCKPVDWGRMSIRERSHGQFTSPRQTCSKEKTVKELQEELDKLNREIQQLQAKGLKEEELQIHIEKLHEYNKLKDVGQAVLGQLASLKCVRTQDVYQYYSLDVND